MADLTPPLSSDAVSAYFRKSDTFAAHIGIEIIEAGQERGVAILPLTSAQLNGMGHAHGGAIFSLADMAFAAASHTGGIFSVNAQSSISYLEPGRVSPLRGEATCLRRGKRLSTYEVRITDGAGTLVAVATVTGCSTGIPLAKLAARE